VDILLENGKLNLLKKNVTITNPSGVKIVANVASIGMYLTLTPVSGLKGKVTTIWQLSFGPETKVLTWAWGTPGGKPPTSYDSAMKTTGNTEYVFTSCIKKDTAICNFDH